MLVAFSWGAQLGSGKRYRVVLNKVVVKVNKPKELLDILNTKGY
jgi:hypothetical protein